MISPYHQTTSAELTAASLEAPKRNCERCRTAGIGETLSSGQYWE